MLFCIEYFSNNATSSSTSCLPSAMSKDAPDAGSPPQQKSVEIAETSYRPQDSPTSGGAPPQFPNQSANDGDEYEHDDDDEDGAFAPDCRRVGGASKLNGREAVGAMGYDGEVTEESDGGDDEKSRSSCLPTFLFVVFVVAVAAVIFAYVLFESDRDLPIVKVLRRLPRVQSARQLYYAPLRDYVTGRFARFVKRLAAAMSMPPSPPV